MAKFNQTIECTLDPRQPVQEICAVISAMIRFHPNKEQEILKGVMNACEDSLIQLDKKSEKASEE